MKVIETLQAPGNPPVQIKWGQGLSPIEVAKSVTMILSMDHSDIPMSIRPRTLSILIEM
jgi:hypothetical protein